MRSFSAATPPDSGGAALTPSVYRVLNETQSTSSSTFYPTPTGLYPTTALRATESTPLLSVDVRHSANKRNRQRRRSHGLSDADISEEEHSDGRRTDSTSTDEAPGPNKRVCGRTGYILKIATLSLVVIFGVVMNSIIKEDEREFHQLSVSNDDPIFLNVKQLSSDISYRVTLHGAFDPELKFNVTHQYMSICLQHFPIFSEPETISEVWTIPILDPRGTEHPESELKNYFNIDDESWGALALVINVTSDAPFPFAISSDQALFIVSYSPVFAIGILLFLYFLIIFEIVHRTLASLVTACLSVAILAVLNERPSLKEVASWVDVETVSLMFSMMVMVAILCETGVFDYTAVVVYRVAKGNLWTLITLLALITAVLSAVLDNVTTIMLMTPITIRLCEVVNVHPKFVLITLVVFSNIGGSATAIGDPPNVLIVSDSKMNEQGVDFTSFTLHMSIGIFFTIIVCYAFLRYVLGETITKQFDDPFEVREMQQEIGVWKRAAQSLSLYSHDESTVRRILKKKVSSLQSKLKKAQNKSHRPTAENFEANLHTLECQYRITDWPLLIKASSVLLVEIIMFFVYSIPEVQISIGWIALLCTVLLLVLTDVEELDYFLSRVEWSTLVFFAALFVIIESLTVLGLPALLGSMAEQFIMQIPLSSRLPVAIMFILWVSALSSAFIDNIPFTTVMLKVLAQLADGGNIGIPIQPLIWALAFGACLGGNGTLIGASANIVCAGVAEQHGYRFTFMEFFKIGFPVMLVSVVIANIYLIICHVLIGWN